VTVFGAVAVSAWFGGWKLGAVTALLGFALINYFIIIPRGAFRNACKLGAQDSKWLNRANH
jgi:hypothetical protein